MKELEECFFDLKPGNETTLTFTTPDSDEIGGKPVHIECRVVHFPFVQPCERTALPEIILKPYSGTWHKGVDYYKA